MTEKRRNPKELLDIIQKEERKEARGKLKIFLGAAPGVGKTYTMLEEALEKQAENKEVLVGFVETHGRKETEAFLEKLKILPRKMIYYRGIEFKEFDLEAALVASPSLILVDELAHSNVPGAKHPKRWQDIEELLDRGIDVYTTVNVQHVESLNNIISQITGIKIRETVPDSLMEKASVIELIDLPPDDLIQRLEEGKVYIPKDIQSAIEHYFRKSNLTALREVALRYTAELVDTEVLFYRRGEAIDTIWATTERLLVCVGADDEAPNLIRTAYRLAKSLHADWIAVSIEVPKISLSEEKKAKLIQHLKLAEELGAETLLLSGRDIVSEILDIAHHRNVTKIVLGKTSKYFNLSWLFPSIADKLIQKDDDIDLYILRTKPKKEREPKKKINLPLGFRAPLSSYIISLLIVLAASILNFFIENLAQNSIIQSETKPFLELTLYFIALLLIAAQRYFLVTLLGFVMVLIGLNVFDFPFNMNGWLSNLGMAFLFLLMFIVSLVITYKARQNYQQTEFSRWREQKIGAMYRLSKALASNRGVMNLIMIATQHILEVFNSEATILLPDENHHLFVVTDNQIETRKISQEQSISQKDLSVAQWVFELGKMAGLGTQTLPENPSLFLPLIGSQGTVGVLKIKPKGENPFFVAEQLHLLEGFASQIAMSLEVDRLQEQARKLMIDQESNHVRNVLLKYLSDNMLTPLIDIMGSANSLIEIAKQLKEKLVLDLSLRIFDNSEELNHLVNKLSQITRLEMDDSIPQKNFHSIDKIIHRALASLRRHLEKRPFELTIGDHLPKIWCNKVFIEQVIFNILENALKYTPANSLIKMVVDEQQNYCVVRIEDRGPGILVTEINKIFDMFYRGQSISHISGMGLGLAICQRIISLHHGKIWAENNIEGGAMFCFTLPIYPLDEKLNERNERLE